MAWLDIVISAVVSAIVWWLGFMFGKRRTHAAVLTCSCGHHYGPHHPDGVCKASIQITTMSENYFTSREFQPCACRYYDGPEPLPHTWTVQQLDAEKRWDVS